MTWAEIQAEPAFGFTVVGLIVAEKHRLEVALRDEAGVVIGRGSWIAFVTTRSSSRSTTLSSSMFASGDETSGGGDA
jgi:hypothetical protein